MVRKYIKVRLGTIAWNLASIINSSAKSLEYFIRYFYARLKGGCVKFLDILQKMCKNKGNARNI